MYAPGINMIIASNVLKPAIIAQSSAAIWLPDIELNSPLRRAVMIVKG